MTALEDALRVPPATSPVEHQRVRDNLLANMFGKPTEPLRVGRFIIETRIGGGGQGDVYRAWDPELERTVAVKVMRHGIDVANREARALARLSDPQVVPVFAWGSLRISGLEEAGYVVTEFVRGQNLSGWLEQRPSRVDRLRVVLGAARGLMAAHNQGVVHGDFKHSNVMVGEDGRARVIDFGIARLLGGGGKDPRADQHALCIVASQVLRGAIRTQRLHRALARGMSQDPYRRFDSLRPIIAALEAELAARFSGWWWIGAVALLVVGPASLSLDRRETAPPTAADPLEDDAAIARAREALQGATQAVEDGNHDEALERLEAALRDGPALPDALTAELWLSRGTVAVAARQIDHARGWLQDALWQASLAGAHRVEAQAGLELARIDADHRSDMEAASRWLERARPAVVRVGDPALIRTLRYREALVARGAGQFEAARAILAELEGDRQAPDAHRVLRSRCILEHTANAGQAAVEVCARATDAYVRTLGAQHPSTLAQKHSYAAALESAGHLEQARDILVATLAAHPDTKHHDRMIVLNSLGIVHEQLGDLDAAQRAYEDALHHLERVPEAPPLLGESLELNLGTLAMRRNDAVEAERRYQRVIIAVQSRRQDPDVALFHALWGLGEALEAQGRPREAVESLEESLSLGQALELGPSKLAHPRVALARVLIGADIDRPRGRAEARRVLADLQAHAPDLHELAADARILAGDAR